MSVASNPTVVAVSGVKNSGKTTLITAMLPHFRRAGVQVAVVKHDGRTFPPAPPDTDTGRYLQAGAMGAAIYDGERTKVIWRQAPDLPGLLELFPQADLILLEGEKHSLWPKLELVRAGNSAQSVCDPTTMLALVTDTDLRVPGIPTLCLNDPARVADFLMKYLERGRST